MNPERKGEMETRCRLYNIYIDVLLRVQNAHNPNFKETRRLDFVSGVMESVLQEGKHREISHPYLANSVHLPQSTGKEYVENNLIGRRMFLYSGEKRIRQGTVTDMGLDEDSVIADSMFAGMKMCGMMAEEFLDAPFIVTVTPIVMKPNRFLEGLPGVVLCDRLEEKEK
jgi:hypothetical protein